ncbi:MAG: NAD(P)H-hydrate dehydratase [Microthrixaceae bacterium]
MIPVVTPAEMAAIDASAPEPTDVLIRRAAHAVRREALDLLGGSYGRRVLVVAGKGNNGNDGRVAAELLEQRGVRVRVVGATEVASAGASFTEETDRFDLLVDAAYGTGFRGTWEPPPLGDVQVLAVDIPSGIDGLNGTASGSPWRARRTVSFAALKPGLLQGDGPDYAGEVVLADIGLDVGGASAHLVTDSDVLEWVPRRGPSDHKWSHALWVVGGSPGMSGAPRLCARGAMRGGAGYVRVSSPGVEHPEGPLESVGVALAATGWGAMVASEASRFAAMVVGPGIGRDPGLAPQILATASSGVPVVVDADALVVLGSEPIGARISAAGTPGGGRRVVLTPHDREYEALMGRAPGTDRLAAAREAASHHRCVVLLKGPTTVVAAPEGEAFVVRSGDQRLATAGTGDVLSGLIGAHLAARARPLHAAAAAAHLLGVAARLAGEHGVVAGDVAEQLGAARSELGAD